MATLEISYAGSLLDDLEEDEKVADEGAREFPSIVEVYASPTSTLHTPNVSCENPADKDSNDSTKSEKLKENVNFTNDVMTSSEYKSELELIPIGVEEAREVVVFDEVIVSKGRKKWDLTLCGYFVGYKMHYGELKYNLSKMWGKFGFKETIVHNGMYLFKFNSEEGMNMDPEVIPLWIKLYNVSLEAWSNKGISALASSLGKPVIMDQTTIKMCNEGVGRIGTKEEKRQGDNGNVKQNVRKEKGDLGQSFRNDNAKRRDNRKDKQEVKNGGLKEKSVNMEYRPIFKEYMNLVNNDESERNMNLVNNESRLVDAVRRSVNKYAIFASVEEAEIDDIQFENGIKNHEEDVLDEVAELAKSMSVNDLFGMNDTVELIHKEWQSNVKDCKRGCRIIIGWNSREVTVMVINTRKDRKSLWKTLHTYSSIVNNNPWVLMEDWSVSLNVGDHSAGGSCKTADMTDFKECIENIEVEDLNFLGNSSFMGTFQTAHAYFLPHLSFDDCPAVLKILDILTMRKRAFKFANFVAEKKEFVDVVKSNWKNDVKDCNMFKLVNKLKALKFHMKTLNWKNEEKAKIMKEYSSALHDEENFLCQQAKFDWLKDGDRNSKFFHAILKARKHKNRVATICNEEGDMFEGEKVPEQFVAHFQKFLGCSAPVQPLDTSNLQVRYIVSNDDACDMMRLVSNEEIKEALFDIEDNKAPGPDGYTSKFFKKLRQRHTLVLFGFPKDMIGWIRTCMSTAAFSINVNRERRGYFKGGRGLRQGDPISPYLFTLVMKIDVEEFSKVSGLVPNMGKSIMFFGNVKEHVKQEILSVMPFKFGTLHVTYLGVPLVSKQIGLNECKCLVEKVGAKVNCWKNKMLTYAGSNVFGPDLMSDLEVDLNAKVSDMWETKGWK
ncbi:RNA-directed DNA polymerase, eukaryota, reverse transcriptase zinc-binding domain protein [Tanacetum coccineum]